MSVTKTIDSWEEVLEAGAYQQGRAGEIYRVAVSICVTSIIGSSSTKAEEQRIPGEAVHFAAQGPGALGDTFPGYRGRTFQHLDILRTGEEPRSGPEEK